jgi:hypothetical protein
MIRVHDIAIGVDGLINLAGSHHTCGECQAKDAHEKSARRMRTKFRASTHRQVSVHRGNVAPMAAGLIDVGHSPNGPGFVKSGPGRRRAVTG